MKNVNDMYDVLVIGSSPIAMSKAILESKAGNSVAIVESDERLGGSWKSLWSEKLGHFETGCHIMYRDKKVYRFLRDEIGIDMKPFTPQPLVIVGEKMYHYKYITMLNHFEQSIGVVVKGLWKWVYEILRPESYCYPANGSEELVDRFIQALKMNNVNLYHGNIEQLELNEDKFQCTGTLNLKAKKVVITPNIEFKGIVKGDELIAVSEVQERNVFNLFIRFKYFEKQLISYVGVKNHFIFRISDMTYNHDTNKRLYCVQIRLEYAENKTKDDLLKEVLSFLVSKNFVPHAFEVNGFDVERYKYSHRMFNTVKNLPVGNVEILYTHNFTEGMRKLIS